jgi:SagB-type dehydrogenase family enzyme
LAEVADTTPASGSEAECYRRARDLVVWWEDDQAYAVASRTGRLVRLTAPLLAILTQADRATGLADLARNARAPRALVHRLIEHGILEPERRPPAPTLWPAVELATQRRAGLPPRADADLRHAPSALTERPGRRIDLAHDRTPRRAAAFQDVLRRRRSIRHFADRPLALAELAELLIESAALQAFDDATASSRRPYPSGGARHSLELFVIPVHVAGLPSGCWWFDPRGALVAVDTTARFRDQLVALLAQDAVAPAGLILITSRFERSLYKYGPLGLSLVYKDTGCLLQTLYLQATAADLAGYAIGGGPEAAIAAGLGLDPLTESYVGAFVFGPAPKREPEDA